MNHHDPARDGRAPRWNVLAMLKLGDGNAATHLEPLAQLEGVRLHVVRQAPVPVAGGDVRWHCYGTTGLLRGLWNMRRLGAAVLRHEPIDLVVAFNLVPYGLLAWRLARRFGKPISMSLIGGDYFQHCHAWYGGLLRGVLRRCDQVTGTGSDMLASLRAWSVREDKLRVLPHAVDTGRFQPTVPLAERPYDFLFVGQLIPLKRVDAILRALHAARQTSPALRLAIVGQGPLRDDLEALTDRLGLRDAVDFLGMRRDMPAVYNQARCVLIASEHEGLPIVLVEAMCCGCVPIASRVGSIGDLIDPGRNGFLVPPGDHAGLAQRMLEVALSAENLARLSQAALEARQTLGYPAAQAVWRDLLLRVAPPGSGAAAEAPLGGHSR